MSLFQTAVDFAQANNVGSTANPPLTDTASSHAITIRTDQGVKIGRIQTWSSQLSLTVDTIFEVQQRAIGEPIEQVSQIQNTNQISVERYEMYTFRMGEAFNVPVQSGSQTPVNAGNDLVSLVLQTRPFNIREVWFDPFGSVRAYLYVGCKFTDIGVTVSATDDRIVKARGTLKFLRLLRLA